MSRNGGRRTRVRRRSRHLRAVVLAAYGARVLGDLSSARAYAVALASIPSRKGHTMTTSLIVLAVVASLSIVGVIATLTYRLGQRYADRALAEALVEQADWYEERLRQLVERVDRLTDDAADAVNKLRHDLDAAAAREIENLASIAETIHERTSTPARAALALPPAPRLNLTAEVPDEEAPTAAALGPVPALTIDTHYVPILPQVGRVPFVDNSETSFTGASARAVLERLAADEEPVTGELVGAVSA